MKKASLRSRRRRTRFEPLITSPASGGVNAKFPEACSH